ncbi:MAG: N-acetylmuramoyl-L-alanine amidase [Elusimicrobia bacterium]|nr:N-acetylmuramoyl-L-alanine amidase [Elusimicrobiota bacterium]
MRLAILLSLLLSASSPPWGGAMEVVSDGRYKGTAEEYRVGKTVYLSAKDVGSVYGAQVYWFPVSGRLKLSLRGRQLELMVGSDTAVLDGKRIPLGAQVILKGTEAFMPAGLLSTKEFSAWTGLRADLDGGKVLSVEKVSTVGPMRWSTHGRHTRLVVELEEGLVYKGSDRGVGGMDLVVLRGVVGAARSERVDDGRVASVSLAQEAGLARISVRFAGDGLNWKAGEIKDPRRLIVDVYSGDEPPPASGGRPAPSGGVAPAKAAARESREKRRFHIVIDPGHGGKDSGAVGRKGTLEKDVVLAVSQALARRLEEEDSLEVLMTRREDRFVPLAERSQAANEFGADLFISIHCNSSPKKIDNGFEIYFLSEKASDPDAARLTDLENSVLELEGKSVEEEEAEIILRAMSRTEFMNEAARFAAVLGKNLGKRLDVADRGVKQAGFYVLRGTDAPAVLLEMAYLSHRKDEARLGSKSFRKKVVEGVYRGIMEFVKEKQREKEGTAL